jgi:hypothetical protein
MTFEKSHNTPISNLERATNMGHQEEETPPEQQPRPTASNGVSDNAESLVRGEAMAVRFFRIVVIILLRRRLREFL